MKEDVFASICIYALFLPSMMEVPKKRKRDVDCPRITYDTSTKVFDRLFKGDSRVNLFFWISLNPLYV